MGSAGRLWIRGRPVTGIGCGIGERGATDIAAEGVLEGGEDGGELDLGGIVEGGVCELPVVKGPVGVVGAGPVVRAGGGGGGGVPFVLEGARVGVGGGGGGGGHSSLGEGKVGRGTARDGYQKRTQGGKKSERGGERPTK